MTALVHIPGHIMVSAHAQALRQRKELVRATMAFMRNNVSETKLIGAANL